jgi:hypothetical protein
MNDMSVLNLVLHGVQGFLALFSSRPAPRSSLAAA